MPIGRGKDYPQQAPMHQNDNRINLIFKGARFSLLFRIDSI